MKPWVIAAAGPHAAQIEKLWWLFFAVLITVFVLVMGTLFVALFRKRRRLEAIGPQLILSGPRERRVSRVVGSCIATTVIILFVLLVTSVRAGNAVAPPDSKAALTIKVTGSQWWWRFEYEDAIASYIVTTANELHIPAGRPVLLKLRSNDVIHSFWVPQLQGKRDLIPGKEDNTLTIQADVPGTYYGQCAEFCGHQHAKMRLLVIAESPQAFNEWLRHEREPAAEPATATEREGHRLFLDAKCVMCHTIRGTDAAATPGPDLTHFGSRRYIAAGALLNTPENLSQWIRDPHAFKPGVNMPTNPMSTAEQSAIASYLESLQ
jgi:cytochrome c oxidase subunit 2